MYGKLDPAERVVRIGQDRGFRDEVAWRCCVNAPEPTREAYIYVYIYICIFFENIVRNIYMYVCVEYTYMCSKMYV